MSFLPVSKMAGSGDVEEASNASESRYLPTTAPSGTTNPPQPPDSHPIIATMLEQELGKTTLSLAFPIIVATFFQNFAIQLAGLGLHFIQFLLTMGCVAIWNGLMLRKAYPRAASRVEQLGIALVFFAFSVLLASVMPIWLVWFPVLAFGFFILPFAMSFCTA